MGPWSSRSLVLKGPKPVSPRWGKRSSTPTDPATVRMAAGAVASMEPTLCQRTEEGTPPPPNNLAWKAELALRREDPQIAILDILNINLPVRKQDGVMNTPLLGNSLLAYNYAGFRIG